VIIVDPAEPKVKSLGVKCYLKGKTREKKGKKKGKTKLVSI